MLVLSRKYVTRTYKLSQTFKAPLDFVYKWSTDFREDDNKIIGTKTKRTFLEKTKRRYVWAVNYKEGNKAKEGIRAVWFKPPNAWHLDTCGDGREVGDYKLTPKGKNRTRLDMIFDVTYDDPRDVESKEEWETDGKEHWKLFAAALEREYKASQK